MRTLQLTLSTPDGTFHGVGESLAKAEGVVRKFIVGLDRFASGETVMLYRVDGPSKACIESELNSVDLVHEFDVVREGEGTYSVFAHVAPDEPLTSLFELVERNALLIDRPITFTDDGVAVDILGTETSLQNAMIEIPEGVDIHIENTSAHAPGPRTLRTHLTTRQQETIRTAMDLGYYETPREVTYEEIAAALDCAPSTANELLRRAEGKLVHAVFSETL
jgi:predicted DNA binding protein